jgi:3-oxoacyl-(acyl-carrier-protein) synthase
MGIISPLGNDPQAIARELHDNHCAIAPLDPAIMRVKQEPVLPVAQIRDLEDSPLPRTHRMAIQASSQAMAGCTAPLDAVIMGSTTGGIHRTEQLLEKGIQDPAQYQHHGLTTVAEEIAALHGCNGPALTLSTACSSGSCAIAMAFQMLQCGEARWILAGGADSLCKLTYYGFHSLQLVDPYHARPLDKERAGMSVAEGAALLLLTTDTIPQPMGEIFGYGLSCDAHHPAAPHPEGRGAITAMRAAMATANISTADIDYINLHGTGTPDNDLAESKAIATLFENPPPLSSIKGATGHSLAASGAIEAAVAAICLQENLIPGNTGCTEPDPKLPVSPVLKPVSAKLSAILSNSFGFGGNNASLVIGKAGAFKPPEAPARTAPLTILGKACITGAGHTLETLKQFSQLASLAGVLESETLSRDLPARKVRRLGRFPRIALALAAAAKEDSRFTQSPHSVFLGSAWGALCETHKFLSKLRESAEQFPSPIDFVGSVHNSAAGQIAIMHGSTGANLTCSGGDHSFEQALLTAHSFLLDSSKAAFVLAADEYHQEFSPLFDPSVTADSIAADGGGGFSLSRRVVPGKPSITLRFFQRQEGQVLDSLIDSLGSNSSLHHECAMILAGIPAAHATHGEQQLDQFMQKTELDVPVIHYRKFTGEFASASAVAAVMAAHLLETGSVPGDKKILILGFDTSVTAMELALQ